MLQHIWLYGGSRTHAPARFATPRGLLSKPRPVPVSKSSAGVGNPTYF